ncbi:phosphoethanolamine transferase [Escherichia coli]|nr:phosphoethanolamine transferase [Escherichia coli]
MYSSATVCFTVSAGQKYRFYSIIMKINLPFINGSQISNDKRLVLSVVVFTLSNLLVSSGAHLIYRVLFFILALLIIKAMKSLTLRFILAFPFTLLTAADISISLYSWCTFGTTFNDGFAISILQTDPDEVIRMFRMYVVYVIAFIILFLLFFCSAINKTSSLPSEKVTVITFLLLITVTLYSSFQFALKKQYQINEVDPYIVASRFATYTPFFNLNYFALAAKEHQRLMTIADTIPHYDLVITDNNTDVFVLVIGESARTDNMSIYGYSRPTTPELQKQKSRLKLFTQAISGAPYTALAVPLALSADTVLHHDVRHYPDNIINMANQAGFDTWWLSAQSAFRQNGTAVASIAMRARNRIYVRGYDELLLPHLAEVLNSNPGGRKLIVLHLTGSHEPVCSNWPRDKAVFKPLDTEEVCYDNSIHYTDSLLGQVFAMLETRRASVMYFSDHGLEYDPTKEHAYFHGGIKPSQQAYHVPMFIWYSPALGEHVDRQTVNSVFSTAYNDYLINAWMGVIRPDQPKTPEEVITRWQGKSVVFDASHNVFDYKVLRKNFNEPLE